MVEEGFWASIQWLELVKTTGLWVLIWGFYMSLIQSTIITVTGVILSATGKTEESLSSSIAISSFLWAIFVMVHFY